MQSSAVPAYNRLEYPAVADADVAKVRELWTPIGGDADVGGDLDRPAACLAPARGRLDTAVVLAEIHLRTGAPQPVAGVPRGLIGTSDTWYHPPRGAPHHYAGTDPATEEDIMTADQRGCLDDPHEAGEAEPDGRAS